METTNAQIAEVFWKKPWLSKLLKVLGKSLLILLETVVLLVITLYGVMFILAKGPSPTARDIFVMSVRETSAVGFIADIFFTPEEIAAIEAQTEEEYVDTDTSLIIKPSEGQNNSGPVADQWGLIDEDGDGIILEKVNGESYNGFMMVVLDPSRIIMGCRPESFEVRGYTVEEMVKSFGAVAGINAGGFIDIAGNGRGETPDAMLVYDGQIYYSGGNNGFVGFDSNHILHTGRFSASDIRNKDIQYGVSFGPVLVSNGEITQQAKKNSGVNPRAAIGQRSDGAVLLLVIAGRQLTSLGATHNDVAEIMVDYGAVNACNLDGGSSAMMWYEGNYLNNTASVIGIRPVPTTFLVMPKEDSGDE